ncbi:hypothetical protein [Candidatus Mycobacterium methanotrophicum]|uniref:hypothetical protein n=1 Tax=Candidatus Mycobacterium methanotrophicum TaxID=2943498 RepID=UPI001C577A2A
MIGGLHRGGCGENLSYSPPFDQHITELLERAEAGGPGDVAPAGFDGAPRNPSSRLPVRQTRGGRLPGLGPWTSTHERASR